MPSSEHVETSKPVLIGDDRLEHMLKTQEHLQATVYGWEFDRLTPEARMAFMRDNMLALMDELHEALGEIGWKPWATSRHMNIEPFISEMVDAWHFFMNLLLATGMYPDEISRLFYSKYMEKSKRNAERQLEGYDGVSTKCADCKRALDDVGVSCTRNGDQGYCAMTQRDINILETTKN